MTASRNRRRAQSLADANGASEPGSSVDRDSDLNLAFLFADSNRRRPWRGGALRRCDPDHSLIEDFGLLLFIGEIAGKRGPHPVRRAKTISDLAAGFAAAG